MASLQLRDRDASWRTIQSRVRVALVALMMQQEYLETRVCSVVNYGVGAETKPFGSQEEVGDVGEAVAVVGKHID